MFSVCRFYGAPLLCVPVLPWSCCPCSGTVKWLVGAVGMVTNGSVAIRVGDWVVEVQSWNISIDNALETLPKHLRAVRGDLN